MSAAALEYVRARSWDEAVEQLQRGGEDARVIAGGQSLAPMMMLRVAHPSLLVDVAGAGTRTIEHCDDKLQLSALVRHVDVQNSVTVRATCPILADVVSHIGNVRVRHRGTVGGTLAHGDSTAEYACVSVLLGATIRTLGPNGQRTIPADEMFVTHLTTALETAEVVTRVDLPALEADQGAGFAELAQRPGDLAMVEVAALVTLALDGRVSDARVVAGAVGARPQELRDAGASLRDEIPGPGILAMAARLASDEVAVGSSWHASVAYRREIVAVLTRRALAAAVHRAQSARGAAA